MVTKDQIIERLRTVDDPELHKDLVSLNMVKDILIEKDRVEVTIELTTPACPLKGEIKKDVENSLKPLNIENLTVKMTGKVKKMEKQELIPDVKHVILVGSGKGGVGKSTVAVNIAISLASSGAAVGLLDADIYGPSIDVMMGTKDASIMTKDGKTMLPIERYGIKFITMGALVEDGRALIWRGPMLQSVLLQFLKDVDWGELDYLVIDLPPGTGDIQLSLSQNIKATGAVIVSTPQDVALSDVKRAKDMFEKVNIPILGVVENMSFFKCPKCGEITEIFSKGGAERVAESYKLQFLGSIPIEIAIREGGDKGIPSSTNEKFPAYQYFKDISENIAGAISKQQFKIISKPKF